MHVQRTQVRVWDESKKDFVTVTVQIAVDVQAIAEQMARKAFYGKRKASKALHGAVEVTIK